MGRDGRATCPRVPRVLVSQGWDSHGDYMRLKVQNLRQETLRRQARAKAALQQGHGQGAAESAAGSGGSDAHAECSETFAGVTVHVDGRTSPSISEIWDIVAAHGGRFEQYLSSRVTHVVAEHLAASKLEKLLKRKAARGGPSYVSARWITDCVAAGRQLPVSAYRLAALRGGGYGAPPRPTRPGQRA